MDNGPMTLDQNRINGIPVVNQPTRNALEERQIVDYTDHKRRLLKWLIHVGKTPDKAEGYADSTVRSTSQKIDLFYRWVWNEEKTYTTRTTTDHADGFLRSLLYAEEEFSAAYKATTQKSLKRYFKWRNYELGESLEWDPEHTFSSGGKHPRDYLTIEERKLIREAALEYGSIPSYTAVTPEEREKWARYLAQRFEMPKSEVGPDDWKRANGWKIPSLVWTSLDAGLRPIEVGRARTSWVDLDNRVLRIPKEESSKNEDNWIVGITERTTTGLERWLAEREHYEAYSGSDALWLTQDENPYGSSSLRYVLSRLCEIAEIPTENRQMSWYTIRHSLGTYMTREEDLAAAQVQLRHKSPETTMKYDQTPVEDRRDALDRMG